MHCHVVLIVLVFRTWSTGEGKKNLNHPSSWVPWRSSCLLPWHSALRWMTDKVRKTRTAATVQIHMYMGTCAALLMMHTSRLLLLLLMHSFLSCSKQANCFSLLVLGGWPPSQQRPPQLSSLLHMLFLLADASLQSWSTFLVPCKGVFVIAIIFSIATGTAAAYPLPTHEPISPPPTKKQVAPLAAEPQKACVHIVRACTYMHVRLVRDLGGFHLFHLEGKSLGCEAYLFVFLWKGFSCFVVFTENYLSRRNALEGDRAWG